MLGTKRVSAHYAKVLSLPYRRLVHCDYCHRVYSPYKKKGINFYGARCRNNCPNPNKSIKAGFIEEEVGKILAQLSFTDEELKEIDTRVRNEIGTLDSKKERELASLENKKRKLREELAYLHQNKLSLLKTKAYSPEEYLAEEGKINKELEALRVQEEGLDVSMQEVIKDVVLLSEMLKDASLYYFLANPHEKEEIIRKIFSEITISGNIVKYKCRNGFKSLENKLTLLGEHSRAATSAFLAQ